MELKSEYFEDYAMAQKNYRIPQGAIDFAEEIFMEPEEMFFAYIIFLLT